MPDAGIDAAAVGVEAADNDVIDPNERGEDAHRGDEPEGGVAPDSKG
jgi:hypothetical protein